MSVHWLMKKLKFAPFSSGCFADILYREETAENAISNAGGLKIAEFVARLPDPSSILDSLTLVVQRDMHRHDELSQSALDALSVG